jgi:hypothetical protein
MPKPMDDMNVTDEALAHFIEIGHDLVLDDRGLPLADAGARRLDQQNALATRDFNKTCDVVIGKRAAHTRNHSEDGNRRVSVGSSGGWAVYTAFAAP